MGERDDAEPRLTEIEQASAVSDLPPRWSSRVSLPRISEGYVTKFAPHKDLKLIA